MKKPLVYLSVVVSFLALTNAFAQTAKEEKDPIVKPIEDTIKVPIFPKIEVKLKELEATPVSFTLSQIVDIDPKLLEGVTINGFARKVSVDNQEIGQVLATSVSKGEKEVAISTTGFSTQFDATKSSELTSDKAIEVSGSKAELLAALQKLSSDETEEEKKEEEKTERQPTEGNSTNGTGKDNDLASSYQTPEPVTVEEKPEPVVTMDSTSEGCEVRLDTAQGVAIVQTKTITLTDGVKTSEDACTDSETRYLIKSEACENSIDTAKMTVTPQSKTFYVDSTGARHEVSECSSESSAAMSLFEDESNCTPEIDYAGNQVIFRTALVYTDKTGAKVEARSCEASPTIASVPLLESVEACPLRHDFAESKSYEMSLMYYLKNGQSYQATSCTDTGRTFAQTKVYGDCPAILDQSGKTVTLQYKRQITIDNIPQYVTACIPDEASKAIEATTDGCEIRHDLAVGVSYQQERYYYVQNAQKIYLENGCLDSETSYIHDQELVGWENHDDQKFGYAKMKVTINTPNGIVTVANNVILDGTSKTPYVFDRNLVVGTGVYENSGCNRRQQQENREVYNRPDDTEYTAPGTATTPSAWVDVCNVENQSKTYHKARINGWAIGNTAGNSSYASCSNGQAWFKNSGFNSTKGWCTATPAYACYYHANPNAGATYAPDKFKAWESYEYVDTRQKKTNPYTNEVFYTSWTNQSSSKDCPSSINDCPSTKTAYNNWVINLDTVMGYTGTTTTSSWANCSDYTP